MRADISEGAIFPDYNLTNHNGNKKKLSELQGKDPVALVLARGEFCPKEDLQHQWMAAMQKELDVGYSKFITVSTDSPMKTMEWRTRLGAHWPFLCDEERKIQQDLNIKEYTDPKHNPMVPHTILLEPGLKIFRIYNGYWYWGRPTAEEIKQDFRALTRKIRQDYDLGEPKVKEQWEKGNKSFFYPYEG